ncbi:MAG TPA: hypothetical protein VF951_04065 [Streptosporangiaceae bacterium]
MGRALSTVVVRWLLVCVLAAAALLNTGCALAMILRPDEVRYGEALLYAHADRLVRGVPLYQPIDQAPYTVAAYTPLYYALAALARVLFGAGFAPGRLVSFAAGLIAVACVGRLTWRRTHAWWPTMLASLLLLGMGMIGPVPWFGSYKEDVLAVALVLGAFVMLDWRTTAPAVASAAVLAALAILTKQTLFAAALAGTIWLWATRGPRLAAVFAAGVTLCVLGVCLAFELTTRAFFENVVVANLNPLSDSALSFNLYLLALFQAAPILAALADAWPRLRPSTAPRDLVIGAWLASIIPVLGIAKAGADFNYWLLFAALTAVLAASAVWKRRTGFTALGLALALIVNTALASLVTVGLVLNQPALVRPNAAAQDGFARVLERVRREPHDVIADPLDVAVLTDHAVVLEPVLYDLLYLEGRWDPAPVVARVCRGDIALAVLGYPLDQPDAEAEHKWPRPVLEALRARMTLQEIVPAGIDRRYVYTRDDARQCAGG